MGWEHSKYLRAVQLGNGIPLWICERCSKSLTEKNAVGHHRKYRRYGGNNSVNNVLLTCKRCEENFPHTRENSEGGNEMPKNRSSKKSKKRRVSSVPTQVTRPIHGQYHRGRENDHLPTVPILRCHIHSEDGTLLCSIGGDLAGLIVRIEKR